MTLWINGDWITGQGALRVRRNPVSGEVLWQGNDADAAQVEQARRAVRHFATLLAGTNVIRLN